MRRPTPIRLLDQRLPQAGRIRTGHKVASASGKARPAGLTKFRFTSKDRVSLEKVAQLYGGEVQPWNERSSPDRWQLFTEAEEIRVLLPSGDPLGGTPIYELWSGGGLERRCDGETVTSFPRGAPEPIEHDCLCAAAGVLSCRLKTRLSVILPDVRFLGIWRCDSNGENAARELPGMVAGVLAVQGEGLHRAILRLEQRVEMHNGVRREFVVPVLGVDASPEEMVLGANALQRGVPERPELVRGEVINLPQEAGSTAVPSPDLVRAWMASLTKLQRNKVLARARQKAKELGWAVPVRFEDIDLDLADEVMANGTP